jgi:biopolymer transport protein ExbD
MRHATVKTTKMRSPLNEAMRLNPRGGGHSKKSIMATLTLTSLVDAFSIMLLYLLVQNTGSSSTLELQQSEKLPTAIKTQALNPGTLVRIEGDKYFIGEAEVTQMELAKELQKVKAGQDLMMAADEKESLIIQADKDADFSKIEPVVRAGSITGFHKFKFAVLQGEDK